MNPIVALALFASVGLAVARDCPRPLWQPTPDKPLRWHWQLQSTKDGNKPEFDYPADVFDLSLGLATKENVDILHSKGKIVICYMTAGTAQTSEPYYQDFIDAGVAGNPWLPEYPNQRWLNIRENKTRELVAKVLDVLAERGCDAVEPDDMFAYIQDDATNGAPQYPTGWNISQQDEVDYIKWFNQAAHDRCLSLGFKNNGQLIEQVADSVDWALTEDCNRWAPHCEKWSQVFGPRNKAVFVCEYQYHDKGQEQPDLDANTICPAMNKLKLNTIVKEKALTEFVYADCLDPKASWNDGNGVKGWGDQ